MFKIGYMCDYNIQSITYLIKKFYYSKFIKIVDFGIQQFFKFFSYIILHFHLNSS